MGKIYAVIKTQFQAIHQWTNCELTEVAFLKYPHHHYFNVKVKIQQLHSDRDVEYIDTQLKLDAYIDEVLLDRTIDSDVSDWISHMGSMSCEKMAEEILKFVEELYAQGGRQILVGVYEDNRHGAEVSNFG